MRRKRESREREAARPVAEELRILERLRERDQLIKRARPLPPSDSTW